MTGPAMVELMALSRQFGRRVVLEPLTLNIPAGAVFGLIGPNGAGKSTLLRLLATVLSPSGGDARIGGHSIRQSPMAVRRIIGFVPATFGVYDQTTAREYLRFFAACYGVPAHQRPALIDTVLDQVQLTDQRDSSLPSLSRGMQQRLGLARALVHDPQCLLLDEPAAGLDPQARLALRDLLRRLQAQGKTIILASHILADLAECCSHVGIIDDGQLRLSGLLAAIQQRLDGPRSLRIGALAAPDHALAVARSLPGVLDAQLVASHSAATPDPGAAEAGSVTLRLTVQGGIADRPALLAALLAGGVAVYDCVEERAELEAVFFNVIHGQGDAAPGAQAPSDQERAR